MYATFAGITKWVNAVDSGRILFELANNTKFQAKYISQEIHSFFESVERFVF